MRVKKGVITKTEVKECKRDLLNVIMYIFVLYGFDYEFI